MATPLIEQHYTPEELAGLYCLSANTIRALFESDPEVITITRPEQMHKTKEQKAKAEKLALKTGKPVPKGKRKYVTMRIPESVAKRVLSNRKHK